MYSHNVFTCHIGGYTSIINPHYWFKEAIPLGQEHEGTQYEEENLRMNFMLSIHTAKCGWESWSSGSRRSCLWSGHVLVFGEGGCLSIEEQGRRMQAVRGKRMSWFNTGMHGAWFPGVRLNTSTEGGRYREVFVADPPASFSVRNNGGSAMPQWGIVLPLSERPRDNAAV